MSRPPPLVFDLAYAEAAADEWRFSCGPASLCAVLGLSPEQVRPHLGDFASKGFMNPTMMYSALRALCADWHLLGGAGELQWPSYGIVRVQWGGPWMKPGVPKAAAYRHTHWVASWKDALGERHHVFDVNAMDRGGWVSFLKWKASIAPGLMQTVSRSDGTWSITHAIEVQRPAAEARHSSLDGGSKR